MNLLKHEVFVAGLFGHDRVPVDGLRFTNHGHTIKVAERCARARHDHHLPIVEEHHLARMREDRGHVGGDKELAFPQPHDDRWTVSGGDDRVGVVGGDQDQCKEPAQLRQCAADGCSQPVALPLFFDQVSNDLGIGFCDEGVASRDQGPLQLEIVLDDAVVDHHNAAFAVLMGMGILFRRPAMCRPACVADAVFTGNWTRRDHIFELREFSRTSSDVELAVPDHGHAGGVIAAVFQFAKPLDQDRQKRLIADVPNNAAHVYFFSFFAAARSAFSF